MKRSLLVLVALAACNQNPILTPVRSFDRPSDVAITCALYSPKYDPKTGDDIGSFTARPLSDCAPLASSQIPSVPDPKFSTVTYYPKQFALVANSARGEVALVDVPNEILRDLDFKNPGYNFVPVGRLPEAIRASADGCYAVTANADSCNLSVLDLPVMYNMAKQVQQPGQAGFAANVERRVEIWAGDHQLLARPTALELTPLITNSGTAACEGTTYHAWVALPGCEAVIETTISPTAMPVVLPGQPPNVDGAVRVQVTQAIHVGPEGATVLADPTSLTCPAECTGTATAATDGGIAGGVTPATPSAPASISYDAEAQTQRLSIADYYGERVSFLTIDPITGTANAPHSVVLESGAIGVIKAKISPRSPAGKFIYALARDGTARVIDLDREVECETNPDPLVFDTLSEVDPAPKAAHFGCLPLGDPATPARSSNAISPGIQLPNGALARDVAFVHLDVPNRVDFNNGVPLSAQPAFMVGDFAWLFGSDGRGTVINLYDACPQPNDPQEPLNDTNTKDLSDSCITSNVGPSRLTSYQNNFGNPFPTNLERLSHRMRLGSRRFLQPNDAQDQLGTPRLQDTTVPLTITVQGSPGVEGNGFRLPTLEPVQRALAGFQPPDAATYATFLEFPDPLLAHNENWTLEWEGIVPGTTRAYGRMCGVGDATCPRNSFIDQGASVCQRGVQAGDKLELIGCDTDSECLYTQRCIKDPGAPATVTTGLCLPRNRSEDDQIEARERERCGILLRAERRYRISSARQDTKLASGDVTDVLTVGEIYEPEYTSQTHLCAADVDCVDVVVSPSIQSASTQTLTTSCLADTDGVKKCLRGCAVSGNSTETGCGAGYVCARSGLGDTRCMRAPYDLGLFQDCLSYPERYNVRVGDGYSISGGSSGFLTDLQPNAATQECEAPPSSSALARLRSPRVPLDAPPCPLQPLVTSGVDALTYQGEGAPNACRIQTNDDDLLLHFEGPILSFALRVPHNPTGYVPEDDTKLVFGVVGGGFPLSLILQLRSSPPAQNPIASVVAPDQGTVYIVDEGKGTSASSLRGQLLRLITSLQECDPSFEVR
ncbi:MAG: hypothetical protein ABI321_17500 [Polyangia bacterium]